MTPLKRFVLATAAVGALLAGGNSVFAVGDNPYKDIVVRNAFGLQPPPPPQTNAPPAPEIPTSNIFLTGVAKIGGIKKAFITLNTPGEKESKYLSIGENERDSGIEVTAIDTKSGRVKIKKGGVPTEISFEQNGAKANVAAAPAGAPKPGVPGVPGAPVPTAVGTTVVTPQGTTSSLPVAPNNSAVAPQRPTTTSPLPTTDPAGATRVIPTRQIRTPGTPNSSSSTPAPNINPAAQAVQIEVNRATQPSNYPPLPPTPLSQ